MLLMLWAAFTIALVHTIIGPDHYLPFVMLARAEQWSLRRTLLWTAVSGLAHVLSSVVLGSIGIAFGWAVGGMESFEGMRGEIASYALIGFGLLYAIWGMWRGHRHPHRHPHHHRHDEKDEKEGGRTPWVLLIIFLLGPCEPLIPLLMVPASKHSFWGIGSVVVVFGLTTIATMLVLVAVGTVGLKNLRLHALERHVHAIAGLTLFASGFLIKVFGL